MIIKIEADLQKAKSLVNMSKITLERLKKTNILEYPSNSLIDYYDCIHKILEALCFIEGIKIKGEGAHQELIDYVFKKYQIMDSDRIFVQEMRDFRNRISYEGFTITQDYIERNLNKIESIIVRLSKLVNLSI